MKRRIPIADPHARTSARPRAVLLPATIAGVLLLLVLPSSLMEASAPGRCIRSLGAVSPVVKFSSRRHDARSILAPAVQASFERTKVVIEDEDEGRPDGVVELALVAAELVPEFRPHPPSAAAPGRACRPASRLRC